jgi:quinol monooxygenase YgiN
MSITRINEFKAKEGQVEALLANLQISVPKIRTSQGCLSCRVLQHMERPSSIVIIEEWASEEAHEQAVKAIPVSVLQETMKLVTEPPYGEPYRELKVG